MADSLYPFVPTTGSGATTPVTQTNFDTTQFLRTGAANLPQHEVDGCPECNRTEDKPWPIFTINYHGVEVCAKCLTPMSAPRKRRG